MLFGTEFFECDVIEARDPAITLVIVHERHQTTGSKIHDLLKRSTLLVTHADTVGSTTAQTILRVQLEDKITNLERLVVLEPPPIYSPPALRFVAEPKHPTHAPRLHHAVGRNRPIVRRIHQPPRVDRKARREALARRERSR